MWLGFAVMGLDGDGVGGYKPEERSATNLI